MSNREKKISLQFPTPSRVHTVSFSELLARPSSGLLISITHFALKKRKEMVASVPFFFIDYYIVFQLS